MAGLFWTLQSFLTPLSLVLLVVFIVNCQGDRECRPDALPASDQKPAIVNLDSLIHSSTLSQSWSVGETVDTFAVGREYGMQSVADFMYTDYDHDRGEYVNDRYLRVDFWGPDKRSVKKAQLEVDEVAVFESFTVSWDIPAIVNHNRPSKQAGRSCGLENESGSDHRYAGIRTIELGIYRFKKELGLSQKGRTINVLNASLISRNYEGTLVQSDFNNDMFNNQICKVNMKDGDQRFVLICYGVMDSVIIKLQMEHHLAAGSLSRSVSVANSVWRSIRVVEWKL